MKKALLHILALVLTVLITGGCTGPKDIRVTSCSIVSLAPSGLRALDGVISLGIKNPMGMSFSISDFSGCIKNQGSEFAYFGAGKLPVARRSDRSYNIPCKGGISDGVGLMQIINLLGKRDFSRMTMDIQVRIKILGIIGKTLRFNDISISDLLEKNGYALISDEDIDLLIQNLEQI